MLQMFTLTQLERLSDSQYATHDTELLKGLLLTLPASDDQYFAKFNYLWHMELRISGRLI
jgi:hypothetical protein